MLVICPIKKITHTYACTYTQTHMRTPLLTVTCPWWKKARPLATNKVLMGLTTNRKSLLTASKECMHTHLSYFPPSCFLVVFILLSSTLPYSSCDQLHSFLPSSSHILICSNPYIDFMRLKLFNSHYHLSFLPLKLFPALTPN